MVSVAEFLGPTSDTADKVPSGLLSDRFLDPAVGPYTSDYFRQSQESGTSGLRVRPAEALLSNAGYIDPRDIGTNANVASLTTATPGLMEALVARQTDRGIGMDAPATVAAPQGDIVTQAAHLVEAADVKPQHFDQTVSYKFEDNATDTTLHAANQYAEAVQLDTDMQEPMQALDDHVEALEAQVAATDQRAGVGSVAKAFANEAVGGAIMTAGVGAVMGPQAAMMFAKATSVLTPAEMVWKGVTAPSTPAYAPRTKAEAYQVSEQARSEASQMTQRMSEMSGGASPAFAGAVEGPKPALDPQKELTRAREMQVAMNDMLYTNATGGEHALDKLDQMRTYFEDNGQDFDLNEMTRANRAGHIENHRASMEIDAMGKVTSAAGMDYLREIAKSPEQYLELDDRQLKPEIPEMKNAAPSWAGPSPSFG